MRSAGPAGADRGPVTLPTELEPPRATPRRRISARSVLNGFGSTMAGNALSLGCGFVSAVATARGLGTAQRGLLLAATLWVTTASWLALLGLQEAIVFLGEGSARRAALARRATRGAAARQSAVTILILLPVIAVITRHSSWELAAGLYASLVIVPVNVVSQRALAISRSAQAFLRWNLVRVVPAGIYAISVTILARTGHLTVTTGITSFIAGSTIGMLFAVRLAHTAERLAPAEGPDGVEADSKHLRRYGLKVTVADIPYITTNRLDQLLLAMLLPAANISLYSVAVSLTTLHSMLAATLDQVLFARFMAQPARRKHAALVSFAGASLCAILLSVPLVPVVERIVRAIYGSAYVPATRSAQVLVVGAIFLVAAAPLTAYAKSIDRVRVVIVAQTVGAVLTVVLLPIAIHRKGILGAAVVSFVAYGSVLAVMVWRLFVTSPTSAVRGEPRAAAGVPPSS